MNFAYFIYKINQKLKLIILYCTYVFKKVYYCSCYNCNGNTFVCKGSFFNTKIILSGRNNTLLIEKGAKLYNVNIFISGCNNKLVIHENVNFKESGRIILEDENNLLEINFENARCTYDTNMNRYVTKKKSQGKVDMVVALINAIYLLQQDVIFSDDWVVQVI